MTQAITDNTLSAPPPRLSLDEIGVRYGTDKSSRGSEPWMWSQNYLTRIYEPLLEPLRDEPITLLELGWGEWSPDRKDHADPLLGGRSARTWREYFTRAHIAVVDIEAKVNTANGVLLFHGSQDDPTFLRDVYLQTGPYDVIIDDASHISSLTIASFKTLWPYLKPGGLYFVEDLHSSFHDWFWDTDQAHPDPGQHYVQTAVAFFQRLAPEAFYNGRRVKGPKVGGKRTTDWDCYPAQYWMGYQVEEVRFCAPQMIVIRKRLETDYAPEPSR